MKNILCDIYEHPEKLREMSEKAYEIADRYFEYHKLAARLYV